MILSIENAFLYLEIVKQSLQVTKFEQTIIYTLNVHFFICIKKTENVVSVFEGWTLIDWDIEINHRDRYTFQSKQVIYWQGKR